MALSQERDGRLTASLHPDALGHGYLSWPAAWKRWHGLTEPDERAQFHMNRGHEHERDAVGFAESTLGEIADFTGESQRFVPYWEWSGCTPDGFIGDLALLECKSPAVFPESPRDSYWIQIQSQLHICKRVVGYLSVWTQDERGLWRTTYDETYWPEAEPYLKAYWEAIRQTPRPKRPAKPKLEFDIRWERVR